MRVLDPEGEAGAARGAPAGILPRVAGAVWALAALVAAAGCGPPAQLAAPPVAAPVQAADVALGPDDVFDVRVFGEADLSGTYRVGPDGKFDYPLIGAVTALGKTPSQLAHEIAQELAKGFLRSPHVSVFVKEYASKKVSVFGQVQRPGTFNYFQSMTVVEAISLAGGFTPLAAKDDALLTRVQDGRLQRVKVPVKAIAEGGATNVFLRPGDIIFVPERIF